MVGFNKTRRLRKKAEYDYVFAGARKITTSEFIVLYRKNLLDHARLGLAISKKHISRAHERNRIKRILRESFRDAGLPEIDIVFLVRTNIEKVKNTDLFTRLNDIWNKLSIT